MPPAASRPFEVAIKRRHLYDYGYRHVVSLEKLARRVWLRKRPGPWLKSRVNSAVLTRGFAIMAENGSVAGEGRTKLHGRAFYESIGSPKYIVAPMVDQSEFVRGIVSPAKH